MSMTPPDLPTPPMLPTLDSDPDEWGPEHDEVIDGLTDKELKRVIQMGDRQGRFIKTDNDLDNGMGEISE
jgi:hypothetical protein